MSLLASTAAIAFDFDGVIADSMGRQSSCWNAAVERVFGPRGRHVKAQIQENVFRGYAGPRVFESVQISDAEQELLRQAKDTFWCSIATEMPLMAGSKDVLLRLYKKKKLGIATTAKRRYVTTVLQREGLLHIFATIVTDEDVPDHPKPDPKMLHEIASHLEVSLDKMVIVGDSRSDLMMATTAGCIFVAFGSGSGRAAQGNVDKMFQADSWASLAKLFCEVSG